MNFEEIGDDYNETFKRNLHKKTIEVNRLMRDIDLMEKSSLYSNEQIRLHYKKVKSIQDMIIRYHLFNTPLNNGGLN